MKIDSNLVELSLADFSGDHQGVHTNLTFDRCVSEYCHRIPITNDMIVEQRESFYVSLARPEDLDERIKLNSGHIEREVIILDDDSKWHAQMR